MKANDQVEWNESQRTLIDQTIFDAAKATRVAARFLPLWKPPMADTAEQVPVPGVQGLGVLPAPAGIGVNGAAYSELFTLSTYVYLTRSQMADNELAEAQTAFRTAARAIASVEDYLMFQGWRAGGPVNGLPAALGPVNAVGPAAPYNGLIGAAGTNQSWANVNNGGLVFTDIVKAIVQLEGLGHVGPFSCTLGSTAYRAIQDPTPNLVLPSDRLKPFLQGGPLLRSSALPADEGIVTSLNGDPIDIAVARDLGARFVQLSLEDSPRCSFRLSEKVLLRVKEPNAIFHLHP